MESILPVIDSPHFSSQFKPHIVSHTNQSDSEFLCIIKTKLITKLTSLWPDLQFDGPSTFTTLSPPEQSCLSPPWTLLYAYIYTRDEWIDSASLTAQQRLLEFSKVLKLDSIPKITETDSSPS